MAQQDFFSLFRDIDAETAFSLARASQRAQQYEDMHKFVNSMVRSRVADGQALNDEERHLLSQAYKSVIGAKRTAWKALERNRDRYSTIESHETYKKYVLNQLRARCQEVLTLVMEFLLPRHRDQRSEVTAFYLRMCGDYHRYLAELDDDSNRDNAERSKREYEEAYGICKSMMHPTNPTRLGTALNLAVCYYEILKEGERARTLSDRAFKEAMNKWDEVDPDHVTEATPILKLLRDNFSIWTEQMRTTANGTRNGVQ